MADSNNIKEKEDKLAKAKIEKDKGNEYFKAGDINNALRHYYISLLNLNGLENDKSFAIFRKEQEEEPKKDPLHEDITKTTSIIYSNMAACHIKKEKWSKAIERADEALKKDPDNTKALFRRAQALIKDGNTTKAREDLTKLSEKDPDDVAIKREWQLLKAKEKEQERKQRKELAGMFDRMKREDEKEERSKKQQSDKKVEQEQKISEIKNGEPKISEIKDEPKISEIKDDEPKISEIEDE